MKPWKPYVIPFVVFLVFTQLASYLPSKAYLLYTAKTILVGYLLIRWRRHFKELFVPQRLSHALIALLSGFFLVYIWVAFDHVLPKLGEGHGFDPFSFGLSNPSALTLAGVRLLGAVLVVPIMEELFWRSFLMRYLIHKDFLKIPLGTYQAFSFWAVAVLFALEHFRIIPGFVAGLVYGGLVCWTKNIRPAILSHMATNLGLGVYVLLSKNWQFW